MAEEKEEKKKLGIVKRILKWVGWGLLTVLIILGLIFQAPWKVITLFAVILLACTILPKPYRKWFWLSVGAVIVILIIWVFLPDETEGWRPYTFDEELAALEAKYAIPDEENAALVYNELFETPILDGNQPEFFSESTRQFWTAQDHLETAQWLQEHQATVEKLLQASKMGKCRFPVAADLISFSSDTDRLSAMRRYAYLLVSSANNDIAEGRVDAALEKYFSLIKIGDHMRQQSTLIDMLVGIAIEATTFRQFNRFIVAGDATEEHLNLIEKALAEIKHDWSYDFPRFLEHEKLLAKNFWGMFYEVNPEGKTRLTRSLANRIREQLPQDMKDELVITYWRKKLMKASTILCWFYMLSTPQKAGEIIDTKYETIYAMANPDFDWRKGTKKPTKMLRLNYPYLVEHLVEILEPAFYSVHDTYLRTISQQRGTLLTIALRRYKNKNGNWPRSLDEVKSLVAEEIFVDPINGGSFIYKLTDENFTLYSKGKNNIDENGKYKEGADDWPIWPAASKKRNAQKENTNAK